MTYETYEKINYAWMSLAVITFLVLLRITAPFGRHATSGWGVQISNRLGWLFMELPGMLIISYFLIRYRSGEDVVMFLPVFFYFFHYINRALIFPFRIHTRGKKMPLLVALLAVGFNMMNGFLLGYYFGHYADYSLSDFTQFHFVAGVVLFAGGMYINWTYDNRLIHLRKTTETGYVIPTGGLFRVISCPNLFGEIVEWGGFALLCWNLPALSFLVWTVANLVPRTLSHHRWYKQHFVDYPAERKAVIPFVI